MTGKGGFQLSDTIKRVYFFKFILCCCIFNQTSCCHFVFHDTVDRTYHQNKRSRKSDQKCRQTKTNSLNAFLSNNQRLKSVSFFVCLFLQYFSRVLLDLQVYGHPNVGRIRGEEYSTYKLKPHSITIKRIGYFTKLQNEKN